MIRRTLLLLLGLCLLSPLPAGAGDFIDTRITFGMSDDNLLLGPGLSNPPSPSTSFIPGKRNTLFFDNYNTRFSGFESLSHIVLYKKLPSFFKGLTTEAALVVRMLYQAQKRDRFFVFKDSSSYLQLTYDFVQSKTLKRNIVFTAFPLSSDRFRLGYSYRLSWAGDSTFPRRTVVSPVPGFKLQLNYDLTPGVRFFMFGGVKTAFLQKLVTKELTEEEVSVGVLAGMGIRAGGFQLEMGAAFFDKGTFANTEIRGETIYFYGLSGQLSYSYGIPIGVSIDFRLYRNDPNMPARFFREEKYTPGKFSFAISSELSYVVNMLQNGDKLDAISPFPGLATDLNFRMKYGHFRLHADVMFRDMGFILKNVPGFVPFQTFSSNQKVTPEFFAAVGVDYHIKKAHLTLGFKGGVQLPAAFKAALPKEVTGNVVPGSLQGEQIVVVRDEGDFILLPSKDKNGNAVDVLPVFSVKINMKWQLSSFMAVIGEALISIDQNQTRLERGTGEGTVESRVFIDPLKIGFNLVLQARF